MWCVSILCDDMFCIYQLRFCFLPILSTNVKREFGGAFFETELISSLQSGSYHHLDLVGIAPILLENPESRYAVGVGTSTILTTFQIFSSDSNNIYTRTSYRVHLTETHRKTKATPGNVKQNRVLVRKASQNDERERCSPSLRLINREEKCDVTLLW